MGFFFLSSKQAPNLVIDFQNAINQPLLAYPRNPNGSDNQIVQFDVSETPPYFYIAVKQTGYVIDLQLPLRENGPLTPYRRKLSGTDNQLWMLVPSDETEQYFFIQSKLNETVISLGTPQAGKTPLIAAKRGPNPASQLWSLVSL